MSFEKATAIWMAVLGRSELTDEQKALFKAFTETLNVEDEDTWDTQDSDVDEGGDR